LLARLLFEIESDRNFERQRYYRAMYSRLIEDHPEQRSRGKAVFTLPLVLLFILVGIASTRHLMNANANNSLESSLAEPTQPNVEGAFGSKVGVAPAAGVAPAPDCTDWWCLDKCTANTDDDYHCDVVLTLDLGSSGTKPALWAIRQDVGNTKIPEIKLAASNPIAPSNEPTELKFKGFCGIWADKYQFWGDLRSYCDASKLEKKVPKGDTAYPAKCAGLNGNFTKWKEHFTEQMKCFLDKELTSGTTTKSITQYISGTYGGITAGLRNDPKIKEKLAAFQEGTTAGTGGAVWSLLKKQTKKPVHLRMISGEEEGYYEWLSFNWDTLQQFENKKPIMMAIQNKLKNTLTIGGASAQIAIPTVQPMSTLDHTYYFHIGVDKYWIYANSIMWAGSTRLKTMVEEFNTVFKDQTTEEPTTLDDAFFEKNDKLLCSDIYNVKPTNEPGETQTLGETQLYKGLCVMGFHFPNATQWLTHQFVGNKDWKLLTGKHDDECMVKGTIGDVKLDFYNHCDGLTEAEGLKIKNYFWLKNYPKTLLPFWGRFWYKLIAAETGFQEDGMLEYTKTEEKSWSAVWASMWMHGKFQGFPNLDNPNGLRRNLGGLKGEYTLGPLTIPAHFGTPEDSS